MALIYNSNNKLSLQKKSKLLLISNFFNENKYIFIFNDYSFLLNDTINSFINKNENLNYKSMVIKSKIFNKLLIEKKILLSNNLSKFNIKGPIILFGFNDLYTFKFFISIIKNKILNQDLLCLICNNQIYNKDYILLLSKILNKFSSSLENNLFSNILLKNKILKLLTIINFKLKIK